MTYVHMHPIGRDLDAEAEMVHALYRDEGVDDAVRAEFGDAVDRYQSLSVEGVRARLAETFEGMITIRGFLPLLDGKPMGMASFNQCQYQHPDAEEFELLSGVVTGLWLLKQHRNQGWSKTIGRALARSALELTRDRRNREWYGFDVITLIRKDNEPSLRSVRSVGWIELGESKDDASKLIFKAPRNL